MSYEVISDGEAVPVTWAVILELLEQPLRVTWPAEDEPIQCPGGMVRLVWPGGTSSSFGVNAEIPGSRERALRLNGRYGAMLRRDRKKPGARAPG